MAASTDQRVKLSTSAGYLPAAGMEARLDLSGPHVAPVPERGACLERVCGTSPRIPGGWSHESRDGDEQDQQQQSGAQFQISGVKEQSLNRKVIND
jgi:hypothetical protein